MNRLIELRNDLILISDNHDDVLNVIIKYEMMIMGTRHNTVSSLELLYRLGINIEEFNDHIPSICKDLGMKYEGLISVKDINVKDPKISMYLIELF